VDRELTRTELDELLPLYALDALDGDERAQVARYVERDADARTEVESLREAAAFIPPRDVAAPASLWAGIESSLGDTTAGPTPPLRPVDASPNTAKRGLRRGRTVVALLAAAAVIVVGVLGVQLFRQQARIDELAAEMHRDPMEQQAMAARAAAGAHVIPLADMHGGAGTTEVVMLPDGTGYLFGQQLPTLDGHSAYQLWAQVGEGASAQMISLGVLGSDPGIVPFRLTATPTMFEVTRETGTGSQTPGDDVVVRGSAT
jgi:hypothetical protein